MYAIKEVRQISVYSPSTGQNELKSLNICIAPNGREMAYFGLYRYVSKDGKTLTKTIVKL